MRTDFIAARNFFLTFPALLVLSNATASEENIALVEDANFYEVLDGSNGGPYVMPGGAHDVKINSKLPYSFQINLTVHCIHPTDHISCEGTVFAASNGLILSAVTFQGACVGGKYEPPVFSPAALLTPCVYGTKYNLNFSCINDITYTATYPLASSKNQFFTCGLP